MRRSGSSSCILRSRDSLSAEELLAQDDQMSVTMVTTKRLAPYSVERYYMLSEIEQNAQSIVFLDEYFSHSNKKCKDWIVKEKTPSDEHSYVILYLLWEPQTHHSQASFMKMVQLYVSRVLQLFGDSLQSQGSSPSTSKNKPHTKIHLVIDRVSPKPSFTHTVQTFANASKIIDFDDSNEDFKHDFSDQGIQVTDVPLNDIPNDHKEETERKIGKESLESHHAVEVKVVERLARSLAKDKSLRSLLEGITIGTTTEVRAAPALESVLKSVVYGSKERRRLVSQAKKRNHTGLFQSPSKKKIDSNTLTKSPIFIITPSSEEMIGLDASRETDAVQGIIQSITSTEWNGNGDYKSFSRRAQDVWKKQNDLDALSDVGSDDSNNDTYKDEASSAMVTSFLLCVIACLWFRYGDVINEYIRVFR